MYHEMIVLEMKRPVPDPAGKSIKKGNTVVEGQRKLASEWPPFNSS